MSDPAKSNEHLSVAASFEAPPAELGAGGIVVVGAGLAGLFAALKLAPLPVTVVSAAPLGEGASSVWAQGGIAAAVGEGDSPEQHAADTIRAGAGLVDPGIAHGIAAEAPARIRDLLAYGVPFDKDLADHFVLSREAAHSAKRVVRVSGDRAGSAIMQALIAAVRKSPSIRVVEGYEAEDLIVENGRVGGVRLVRSAERGRGLYTLMPAAAVVLATGGIGHLFAVTTNPPYARGQALAFAARAGALVADAEFVQFHPTALDLGVDPAPLASEALRGEGATLLNSAGHRFMADLHEDAELAPRDVVARGVFAEIAAGRGAFLDCRTAIGEMFSQRFPTVFASCMAAGLDPARDLIPVAPAAHYHMGGLATTPEGRTSLPGLWAIGEVAATGLHGANRLASNSLLEAVAVGARAAGDIASACGSRRRSHLAPRYERRAMRLDAATRRELASEIRALMARHVGVVRDRAGLCHALLGLGEIEAHATADTGLANMALAARLVTAGALLRRESRGAHLRTDFPETDPTARHGLLEAGDVDRLATRLTAAAAARDATPALQVTA